MHCLLVTFVRVLGLHSWKLIFLSFIVTHHPNVLLHRAIQSSRVFWIDKLGYTGCLLLHQSVFLVCHTSHCEQQRVVHEPLSLQKVHINLNVLQESLCVKSPHVEEVFVLVQSYVIKVFQGFSTGRLHFYKFIRRNTFQDFSVDWRPFHVEDVVEFGVLDRWQRILHY